MAEFHVYGVRHHGPGSARSLRRALESLQPDCVLIEGPPDADEIISLAARQELKPPVAILVYAPKEPQRAVYYPFAEFSPEWQAIRFAIEGSVEVRFMDLPVTHQFALDQEKRAPEGGSSVDPLDQLAEAAGFGDGERWWNRVVEERRDGEEVFTAITEVMVAARRAFPGRLGSRGLEREKMREAHMRRSMRRVEKDGFQKIAVVCGAWHVPALIEKRTAREDDAILKGLPKMKVEATWIPWTHGRLSFDSGYGAGIDSPGWYRHLFLNEAHISERWLTSVARLLREAGLDAAPSQVIDAVRLAEFLAALRDRPLAGLEELNDATRAAMLFGDDTPMKLIRQQLIVGEAIGEVPEDTPAVPLLADLRAEQKRLRFPAQAEAKEVVLDLRAPFDRERSQLLRRLRILGIEWGEGGDRAEGRGTFKEAWLLQWSPELVIAAIEASVWGTTILGAATARAKNRAQEADLPALAAMVRDVLSADLPEAVEPILTALASKAAVAGDLTHLLVALPELARTLRYGDVRGTETSAVEPVIGGIVARISVGLANAAAGLGPEAAEQMVWRIEAANGAIGMLDREAWTEEWRDALKELIDRENMAPLIAGRATRLLLQAGALDRGAASQKLSFALSSGAPASASAAWIEGFLRGSGQVLIHDPDLLDTIDRWISSLPEEPFTRELPILRRTFAGFSPAERRAIGERLVQTAGKDKTPGSRRFDAQRGDAALPLIETLLGLES